MEDGGMKVWMGIAESNGGKEFKTDCEESNELWTENKILLTKMKISLTEGIHL